jgi:oligoribonuclease
MEMSGLDPETSRILELAAILTDADLNVVAEGPEIVIHQPSSVLEAMDEWNTRHHGESGLSARSLGSDVAEEEAERLTLAFLSRHCRPGTSPLCGNSVGQDRLFLKRYMPRLESFLHYRNVDVSSIKELVRRWYPGLEIPPKRKAHRAKEDILESIAELRFYRSAVFRP